MIPILIIDIPPYKICLTFSLRNFKLLYYKSFSHLSQFFYQNLDVKILIYYIKLSLDRKRMLLNAFCLLLVDA